MLQDIALNKMARELARIGRYFHARKWSLATSSNYSAKVAEDTILITSSGKDKQYLKSSDMMLVNFDGLPVKDTENLKPSAETLLHCQIYKRISDAQCVLHTHSMPETVLSMRYRKAGKLIIDGLEMIKAFNTGTHEYSMSVPIFENDQDMTVLSSKADAYMEENSDTMVYMIAGHGLYTWGKSVGEAKNRIEAIEFLLECRLHSELFEAGGK